MSSVFLKLGHFSGNFFWDSWEKERSIVAKIEHHEGELFPWIGYIVTSLKWNKSRVVKFYNKRSTCDQWIKEGKYALNRIRLRCQVFGENEVRLKLFIMAYNLGSTFRTPALAEGIMEWLLRAMQLKLIKIGGRLRMHALLLHGSGRGDFNRMDMAWYYEQDKPSLSFAFRITGMECMI